MDNGAQKNRKGHTYATTYKEGCSLGYDVLCLKILHDFHVTFGKLPLQRIMTVLAYKTELVITLWNFIKKCHENQKWSSLTSNDAPGWLLSLAVFCPVYKKTKNILC